MADTWGGPRNGIWAMTTSESDPGWLSPPLNLAAATHGTLEIKLANDQNPAADAVMQVFWSTVDSPGFAEAKSATVAITNDGTWSTYTIDLASLSSWTGQVDQLRIDPILSGDGHVIALDSVVFR